MLKREVKEKHISSVEIHFDSLDDLLDGPILGRSVKAAPAITSSSKIPEASEAGEATIAHLVPRCPPSCPSLSPSAALAASTGCTCRVKPSLRCVNRLLLDPGRQAEGCCWPTRAGLTGSYPSAGSSYFICSTAVKE